MKTTIRAILVFGMAIVMLVSGNQLTAADTAPTGYDLTAAVNAYRASNGYYPLSNNSLVMAAAQGHADWIVETGQGGHYGASGSLETERVSWTGYGGGAEIKCDENWAGGGSINDALYSAWSDWDHQEVMLNQWGNLYTDIGGGVASYGDGRYVFVLNVCKVIGQEASGTLPESSGPETGEALIPPTPDVSNYIYGVTLATPLADGTIKHKVLYGQSLESIAQAYGVTVETLRTLNQMAADDSVIWVDEELLIAQGTGVFPTATSTPVIETQTPQPTLAATLAPTMTATQETDTKESQPSRTLGVLLIIAAGLGLAASVAAVSIKKTG